MPPPLRSKWGGRKMVREAPFRWGASGSTSLPPKRFPAEPVPLRIRLADQGFLAFDRAVDFRAQVFFGNFSGVIHIDFPDWHRALDPFSLHIFPHGAMSFIHVAV